MKEEQTILMPGSMTFVNSVYEETGIPKAMNEIFIQEIKNFFNIHDNDKLVLKIKYLFFDQPQMEIFLRHFNIGLYEFVYFLAEYYPKTLSTRVRKCLNALYKKHGKSAHPEKYLAVTMTSQKKTLKKK